ncbi:TPA: Adenylate kinase 7 [Trebouxia sp. C0005]
MRVYVHDPESYIGRALCAAIKAQGVPLSERQALPLSVEIEHVQQPSDATVMQSDLPQNAEPLPESVSVDELSASLSVSAESSEHMFSVKEPNVFIYTLSLTADSVQQALAALKKQKLSTAEQVFIVVTTPLTWAKTQLVPAAAMTAVQSEQRELQAASMQPSDTPTDMITSPKDASTAGPSDDATISGTADAAQSTVSLTSADAACRKSAACARTVLEAERTILAAASKTLRTYVICPGILYGNGETAEGLHSLFRTAWEAQPDAPVPIYGSGHNVIPTIHVADLAAYVAAVCIEPPAQQYLLAVDNVQLTQRDIVAAVAKRMRNTAVQELGLEELYFQQGIEHMLLNLPMTLTPLDTPPSLQYADGLIAQLDAVVQQYIEGHSLQPLRMMITGPPAVGKSSLAARLAQHYQLQLVSAKTILAAADELGGSTKQEVQAELSSKAGRVSDINMVKLCSHVLSKRDMRMRGFLLEGWPKTPEQAEQLFTQDQPYMLEERQRLEALRDAQAGITAAAPAPAVKGKPAKPDPKGGKAPLKPDLPKRLIPLPDLFPTHVIHLDAPEPTLLSRCLALGEHELAAARAAASAAAAAEGKPAAPAKSKAKEPAGPMTHNTDKDFKRRYATYKASHESDAASLKAMQAAEQLWLDDKKILLEAAAAAEADAAAAASAKTLRLTALATMKSMGPGSFAAALGAPSRHGSTFLTARSRNASVASLMPGELAGNLRKGSGSPSPDFPAAAALAAHLKAGVPQLQHGGLLGLFAKHNAQVLFVETSSSTGLDSVVASVTTLVGAPHNYTVSDSRPENSQPTDASRPAGALAAVAGGGAVDHATDQAALEVQPAQLTAEEAAEKAHIQRCRAETVAMRAEPMKRYLMQQLMPVLAKAMVEAAEEQAADPVQFVAHKLLEVRLRLMSLGTGLIKGVSVLDAMILYSSLSLDRHQSAFWSDPNTSCDAQLIAGQVAAKLTVSWHTNKHCPGCRYL